jgi:hypothetical protein
MWSSGYRSDTHEGLDLTVRGTGQMKKKKGRKLLGPKKTLDTHWRPAHTLQYLAGSTELHTAWSTELHTLSMGDLAIPLRRIGEILLRTNCILGIRNLAINDVKFLASTNNFILDYKCFICNLQRHLSTLRSDQDTEILDTELISYLEANHVVRAKNEYASISKSGPKQLEERAGRRLKRPGRGVLASISII